MKKIILLIILFSIPLVAANSPPVIEDIGIKAAYVGEDFSYLAGFNDPDGDVLKLSTDSDFIKISPLGLIKFKPKENQLGIHRVKIFANDGEIKSQSEMVLVINKNITVNVMPRILERHSNKDNVTETISITNDGDETLFIVAENTITREIQDIQINPKDTYSLNVLLYLKEPISTGKIILHGLKNNVNVITAQFSKSPGYGISLEIPAKFREPLPGKDISADITISNIDDTEKNISVSYIIKDFDNNIVKQDSESFNVMDDKKYTKKMKLPDYIGEGEYVFAIVAQYKDKTISSAETFSISGKPGAKSGEAFVFTTQIIISIIIVILIIVLLVMNYGHISKIESHKVKHVEKIYQKLLIKKEEKENIAKKIKKLEKQLISLKEAYKEKIISEESYKKDKTKIEKLLKKLKSN